MTGDEKNKEGVHIVLTASAAEMSHYEYDPFVAFVCTFPYKLTRNAMKKHLQPIENDDGSTKFAPYGLRKLESLLVDEFGAESVVVCHPDSLDRFVGKNTKIVCVSAMDPMGLAYVSTTYNSIVGFGGEALNAYEFNRLMQNPVLKKYRPKIVVGGSGTWQIKDAGAQAEYGIDTLISGEAERDLAGIVRKILSREKIPDYIRMSRPDYNSIPLIKNAANYGSVEITRGCGRGCQFCSPTMRVKHSFPLEHILKEVEVNVKHGAKMIFTITEDMFLYRSFPGFIPNREAVVELYSKIAKYPIDWIHLSHASLAPVVYDPKMLEELTPVLLEKSKRELNGRKFVTVEVGIETGSIRLMQKHMKGKALPFSVEHWPEIVREGIGIMNDNEWYPLATIMAGMPGETEEDVIATLELLDELKGAKMFYTPVLFIPLEEALLNKAKRAELNSLSELHWEFISTCWKNNLDIWTKRNLHIKLLGFLLFWAYVRWKHGSKATRPVMRFVGLEPLVGHRVGKRCEPDYCAGEKWEFPTATTQMLR